MNGTNAEDQILARLAGWGCDIPGTLPRFAGNRGFYCRLLAQVPGQEEFTLLGGSLAAGDIEAAFGQAHTLKGVLGNMGLAPMYSEACAIVEPLRAGTLEGTKAHYEALLQQRDELEAILKEAEARG